MEILHKVALYSVLAFVVIGGAISLAGPQVSQEDASAERQVNIESSISGLELLSAEDSE